MTDTMYAHKDNNGFFTLRQTRYEKLLAEGREHKNDVCAVASSAEQLKEMCIKYWPEADYSKI